MQPIPVPSVTHTATAHPQAAAAVQNQSEIKSAKAFKDCAKFTAGAGQLLVNPKYSLLWNGIKLMCEPRSGGYLSGLEQGVGFLCVLASPAALALKGVVLLPVTVGAAGATVVTGGAAAAEWSGKKIGEKISQGSAPSEASIQREHLTQQFVNKMHEILGKMSHDQAYSFRQDPKMLIPITAIGVAFLSRGLEGPNSLKIGDEILRKEDIAVQDTTRKNYFTDLIEIKLAIRGLHLSLEDAHAWNYLMRSLNCAEAGNSEDIDLSEQEKRTLAILKQHAESFADRVTNDEVFQRVWSESIA